MAKAFRRLGFEVIQVLDGNQEQMETALNCFNEKLKQQNGVGVFYYAGHGVQVKGENYLIPVNVNLTQEGQVKYRTLPLEMVISTMETANNKPNNINIIILDSCNNDPFSGSWNRSFNIQGLAPIQTTRSGSLIAYATQPGKTVDDSGLFTVRILEKIEQPGLDVLDLFRQVGQEIAQGTGSEQVPAITLSSLPDFSFNPSGAGFLPPPPPPTSTRTERLTAIQFYNRGNDKREQGDYQGAIEDYTQAVTLKPDYAVAYHDRGFARDDLGDYLGAIEDYNQAIRLNPDYANAYNNRGAARSNLEDYEGAIVDYTQAIKLDPDYAVAYHNRGNARYNLEDYEGAIADYTQSIRFNPDNAVAYHNRGLARYELGDYEGEIADYDQAIRLDPDYAEAYYNRGLTYKIQGKIERARADFLKAADLYRQQGNKEWYEDAIYQLLRLE